MRVLESWILGGSATKAFDVLVDGGDGNDGASGGGLSVCLLWELICPEWGEEPAPEGG